MTLAAPPVAPSTLAPGGVQTMELNFCTSYRSLLFLTGLSITLAGSRAWWSYTWKMKIRDKDEPPLLGDVRGDVQSVPGGQEHLPSCKGP